MVRLPAGHGGWNASSPELLVDGEEKKSGSAAAFLRRGGATVAGGGPATVRREGRVSSMLHGRRTMRGELGRRSPWSCSRRRRRPGSDGRLRTGCRRGQDERGEAVGRPTSARALLGRWRRGRGELSGRAARCPDNGFKPWRQRGACRPRGNGTLPRGPSAARGV
jgi:hypothetical protein